MRNTLQVKRWKTAAGMFSTNKTSKLLVQLPEFSTTKKIVHTFHVAEKLSLGYDMIIGLDLLNDLGVVIDFEKKVLTWDGTDVEMPQPKNITVQELRTLLAESVEPKSTASINRRAIHILDAEYKKANLDELFQQRTPLLNEEQNNELLNY